MFFILLFLLIIYILWKNMKNFYLLLLFITFIVNAISFVLVILYLDPFVYQNIAYFSFLTTFNLASSSLIALVLMALKHIYFRGRTDALNVLWSMRQGFFISLFLTGTYIFYVVKAPMFLAVLLLFVIFLFLEILSQTR